MQPSDTRHPNRSAGRDRRGIVFWVVIPGIIALLMAMLVGWRMCGRMHMQQRDAAAKTTSVVPVKVITTRTTSVPRYISHSGVIQAWQQAILLSEVTGTVEQIAAKVGDRLEPGDLIMKLDDEMLQYAVEQAEASVLQLEAQHEKSVRELTRKKKLFTDRVISDFEFDISQATEKADRAMLAQARAKLKVAQRDLRETAIVSPIRGVLAERNVDVGTNVALGTRVATVVDIERVKIRVGVSDRDVALIAEGMPVTVELDAYADQPRQATVYSVGTKADDATLTFPVEIVIANDRKPQLKPGMVARVRVLTGSYDNAVVLPQEALVRFASGAVLWTVKDGLARSIPITVTDVIGSEIIITSGLPAGVPIVISGQNTVVEGSSVVIVNAEQAP